MTPEEVQEFAMRENHSVLWFYCCAVQAGKCTWEDAMTRAAVDLSKHNKELLDRVIQLHNERAVQPLILKEKQ